MEYREKMQSDWEEEIERWIDQTLDELSEIEDLSEHEEQLDEELTEDDRIKVKKGDKIRVEKGDGDTSTSSYNTYPGVPSSLFPKYRLILPKNIKPDLLLRKVIDFCHWVKSWDIEEERGNPQSQELFVLVISEISPDYPFDRWWRPIWWHPRWWRRFGPLFDPFDIEDILYKGHIIRRSRGSKALKRFSSISPLHEEFLNLFFLAPLWISMDISWYLIHSRGIRFSWCIMHKRGFRHFAGKKTRRCK